MDGGLEVKSSSREGEAEGCRKEKRGRGVSMIDLAAARKLFRRMTLARRCPAIANQFGLGASNREQYPLTHQTHQVTIPHESLRSPTISQILLVASSPISLDIPSQPPPKSWTACSLNPAISFHPSSREPISVTITSVRFPRPYWMKDFYRI